MTQAIAITYVDEIRPVLARHAKPKVSPESSFLPYHLRQNKRPEISLLHYFAFALIRSRKFSCLCIIFLPTSCC